jgi:hypothetical protein
MSLVTDMFLQVGMVLYRYLDRETLWIKQWGRNLKTQVVVISISFSKQKANETKINILTYCKCNASKGNVKVRGQLHAPAAKCNAFIFLK